MARHHEWSKRQQCHRMHARSQNRAPQQTPTPGPASTHAEAHAILLPEPFPVLASTKHEKAYQQDKTKKEQQQEQEQEQGTLSVWVAGWVRERVWMLMRASERNNGGLAASNGKSGVKIRTNCQTEISFTCGAKPAKKRRS